MTSENIVSVTLNFTMTEEYIKPSVLFELLKDLKRKYSEWAISVVDGETAND